MANIKVLVNFKTRKVITTDKRKDSRHYLYLTTFEDYVHVATIKIEKETYDPKDHDHLARFVIARFFRGIYIEPKYFSAQAKKQITDNEDT